MKKLPTKKSRLEGPFRIISDNSGFCQVIDESSGQLVGPKARQLLRPLGLSYQGFRRGKVWFNSRNVCGTYALSQLLLLASISGDV